MVKKIVKRDKRLVNFDLKRIVNAVYAAMRAEDEGSQQEAKSIAQAVASELDNIVKRYKNFVPDVEGVQDAVEKELILGNYVKTAKHYILYRNQQTLLRENRVKIPAHTQELVEQSNQYFRNDLAKFVYLRTYARWIEPEGRRETWIETVQRYMDFMHDNIGAQLSQKDYEDIKVAILKQEVMPSMRLLQFSGEATRKTNVCAYNCSFIAPKSLKDFTEVMYISMCGTGVGFSVEAQNIQELPQIQFQNGESLATYRVDDSKEGWCDAFYRGLTTWFDGKDIDFDFSHVRPAGSRLKTMGGKSSGPEPFRELLDFSRTKILQKQGRRLSTLDVHDILCKIGEIVVTGGVRRSAMISLSDLDDQAMRDSKKGQFYYHEPQRAVANNSAVYTEFPSNEVLLDEWIALIKSGSGERGIFNRDALLKTLPERRLNLLREKGLIVNDRLVGMIGTNPCAEIILQSKQFCNLSEVIARADDTLQTLTRKVRLATLLGTYQSTLTHFPYLSREWEINCQQERLLGVSITGQWDSDVVRDPEVLSQLKKEAVAANKEYAQRLGVEASTCVTCVKPSGTVSQAVDCASGMHPRHAPYYIRRIRISSSDALFKMLRDHGIPVHPEVGQSEEKATTFVIDFPVKSPDGAICKDDISALDQLAHWKMVKENYTEHNPSVTVSVGENEWIGVINWVYENWGLIGGLSFLPRSKHVYQLAPYEEIDQNQYLELNKCFDNINYAQLITYERKDETELKRELACAGGNCEIEVN